MQIIVPSLPQLVLWARSPLFWQVVFIGTGVIQSMALQVLKYQGATDSFALTPILFVFLGTVCVRLWPRTMDVTPKAAVAAAAAAAQEAPVSMRLVLACAGFEFLGNVFSTLGLGLAGSGVHIVTYSSMTLWTALMNRVFMKRGVSSHQLAAILVVFLGLCFNVLGASRHASGQDPSTGTTVLLGVASTLLGTMSFAANYVIGEAYMTSGESRPNPRQLSWHLGRTCLSATAMLWAVLVLPRARTQLSVPWTVPHVAGVLLVGLSLTAASSLHTLSWYMSLGSSGAVSTGVNQAVRAVVVFLTSSVLFCRLQHSQCFTSAKALSCAVVIAGVLMYARATAARTKHAALPAHHVELRSHNTSAEKAMWTSRFHAHSL